MAALVIALSISDRIEKYGAICGYAAILGLAVLSLLYFAQAREVKRLREWAGRAPERDADLQQRVIADAQRRAQIQATPAPAQRPPAGAPATAAAQRPGNGGAQPGPAQPGAPGKPAPGQPDVAAPAAPAGGAAAAAAAAKGGTETKAVPGATETKGAPDVA